jgi:hypothetical protein
VTNFPTLPPGQAQLPATYEAAQRALAECSRIDECKGWADKAQALASYARQAKDSTLHNLALRIQNRAMRRAGELLQQIQPSPGARTDLGRVPTRGSAPDQPAMTTSPVTRGQAATDAGLSEHQRKTALRIATVPVPEFEAAVESNQPPTVTQMAAMGTAERVQPQEPPAPQADRVGAASVLTLLRELSAFCATHDAAAVAAGITDPEVVRGYVESTDAWFDRFVTRLPARSANEDVLE